MKAQPINRVNNYSCSKLLT